jgi:hypothetical protein
MEEDKKEQKPEIKRPHGFCGCHLCGNYLIRYTSKEDGSPIMWVLERALS